MRKKRTMMKMMWRRETHLIIKMTIISFITYIQQTVCCIIIFVMDAFSCFYNILLCF